MTRSRTQGRLRRTVATTLVASAVAAVPVFAAPQTVALDRTCFSPGEPIAQVGTGFTAGAEIAESLSLLDPATDEPLRSFFAPPVRADAEGSFKRLIPAPRLARRTDRREPAISAFTDQTDPQRLWTSVPWTLSAWEVEIDEWARGRANPRGTMVVDTYGWTSAGSTLYAHYYRGRAHVRDVRLGALRGACGDLRKRVRQFPFRGDHAGRWKVFFSATRKLDRRDDAWIAYGVRVSRRYTASPASTRR